MPKGVFLYLYLLQIIPLIWITQKLTRKIGFTRLSSVIFTKTGFEDFGDVTCHD